MKSILRSMYQGDIIPWAQHNPNSKERCEILEKIEAEEKYLQEKLSLDDYHKLSALSDLYTQLTVVDEEDLYAYAFTLGMLIAMEAMKEAEAVFND